MLLSVILWNMYSHPCIKQHQEWVKHDAWVQYVLAGKVLVPIFHKEKTTLDTICDVRK